QFGEDEDFDSYPRTEQADQQKLADASTDILFIPDVREIYPNKSLTVVSVAGISESHCGASRTGHFDGVATVVCKLFNIVQPDKAFFGEKDFQQLSVIRQMVADLNSPVEIIAVATQRDSDGLAMSSRNGYLTTEQRQTAPLLYQSLCNARQALQQGERNIRHVELQQQQFLQQQGFELDYFAICRADNLQPACVTDKECIILVAAQLGIPRLIDNVLVSLS
ncbi:MAG: pantoate--beta-alanine ligase, partial [Mycoplasmataceae bacterium]|nr:pantoate--beta-alanine ligase [Mycoplasmataceae bacterium]